MVAYRGHSISGAATCPAAPKAGNELSLSIPSVVLLISEWQVLSQHSTAQQVDTHMPWQWSATVTHASRHVSADNLADTKHVLPVRSPHSTYQRQQQKQRPCITSRIRSTPPPAQPRTSTHLIPPLLESPLHVSNVVDVPAALLNQLVDRLQ
jgi:hypothetical protein